MCAPLSLRLQASRAAAIGSLRVRRLGVLLGHLQAANRLRHHLLLLGKLGLPNPKAVRFLDDERGSLVDVRLRIFRVDLDQMLVKFDKYLPPMLIPEF